MWQKASPLILCGVVATAAGGAPAEALRPRQDLPPRKVIVGTAVQSFFGNIRSR